MTVKDIPAHIKRRIRYIRGDGYKIVGKNGTLSAETYHSQVGAAMMLLGTFHSHAFNP